jgi:ABC-type sugar transport system permease subunit
MRELSRLDRLRRFAGGDSFAAYVLIGPFLITFMLFFISPAVYSLALSFAKYRGYGRINWVGLANYTTILSYDAFWITLRNSAFYWVAHAIPMMSLALFLAIIARSQLLTWSRTFRTIVFLPQLLAIVAAAMIFQNLFGENYGAINKLFGLKIAWLTDSRAAPWTVVAVLIWRNTGYWFVIFLAALTAVPPELEEASKLDGANAFQRFRYVIFPLMRPTILFAILVDAIVTLRLFTEPNVILGLAGASAPTSVAPLLNLVVDNIRSGQYGLASATGWLLFAVTIVISLALSHLLKTGDKSATQKADN